VAIVKGCIPRLPSWEAHSDCIAPTAESILRSYAASRRMIQHTPLFVEHFGRHDHQPFSRSDAVNNPFLCTLQQFEVSGLWPRLPEYTTGLVRNACTVT